SEIGDFVKKYKKNSLQEVSRELDDIFDTYSVKPRTISSIKSGIQNTINARNDRQRERDEARNIITEKDARIGEQAKKITKAVEILNQQKKEISQKKEEIKKLEEKIKNI